MLGQIANDFEESARFALLVRSQFVLLFWVSWFAGKVQRV